MALTEEQEAWVAVQADKEVKLAALTAAEDAYRTVQDGYTGEVLAAEQEYNATVESITATWKPQQIAALAALAEARADVEGVSTNGGN